MIFQAVFWGFLVAVNGNDCYDSCTNLADGLYQKCGTCTHYLHCSNQQTNVQPCPPGLKWDNDLPGCLGTSSTCTDSTGSGATCGTDACTSSNVGSFFRDCSDCTKYIQCATTGAVEQECSSNLHWNAAISNCDNPANANCPYTDSTGSTYTCGINACADSAAQFFPQCNSCSEFIQCSNNEGVVQECSEGLYWDPAIPTCDYQANVNCPYE